MAPHRHRFKVRMCDIRTEGLTKVPGASDKLPFSIRINFDGSIYDTNSFPSAGMEPIFSSEFNFTYDVNELGELRGRFVVIEAFGKDVCLGRAELNLDTVARGPTHYKLDLSRGSRSVASVEFNLFFAMQSGVSMTMRNVRVHDLPARGYENAPNAYLAARIDCDSGHAMESAVCQSSSNPFWETLMAFPPVLTTIPELCEREVIFTLKHALDPYCIGLNDPVMSRFEVSIGSLLGYEAADQICAFNVVVHSERNYPFPFSARMTGDVQFTSMPTICQLAEGTYMTTGEILGAKPLLPYRGRGAVTSVSGASPAVRGHDTTHMQRDRYLADSSAAAAAYPPPVQYSTSTPASPFRQTRTLSPARARPTMALPTPAAPPVHMPTLDRSTLAANLPPSPMRQAVSQDVNLIDDVTAERRNALSKMQHRLTEVRQRKKELVHALAMKSSEEQQELEQSRRRRASFQGELEELVRQREATKAALLEAQQRRQTHQQRTEMQAVERQRVAQTLASEEAELLNLERKVMMLRDEMARHAEEEELRYKRRVESAVEAHTRADRDLQNMRSLEEKLQAAEKRAKVRLEQDEMELSRLQTSRGRGARPASPMSPGRRR